MKDTVIRYNSMDGFLTVNGNGDSVISGCWSNVRIIGNIYKNSDFAGTSCGGVDARFTQVTMAYNAVQQGAAGVDMGRNIFQSDAPKAMIQAVHAVVHKNMKPTEALDMFHTLKREG